MSINTLVFEQITGTPKRYVSVNMPDHAVMSRERFLGLSFNDRAHIAGDHITFEFDDGTWVYRIDDRGGRFIHMQLVKDPDV